MSDRKAIWFNSNKLKRLDKLRTYRDDLNDLTDSQLVKTLFLELIAKEIIKKENKEKEHALGFEVGKRLSKEFVKEVGKLLKKR